MRKRKRGYRRGKWGCILLLLVGMAGFLYVTRDSGYKFPEVLLQKGEKEVEEVDYLPAGDGELVRHVHYSLSFDTCHKQAEWVYYLLDLKGKEMKVPRTDRFEEDPQVSSGSAKPSDYSRSGYDRGHLCPAADMAYSAEAMRETFLMSNISPQISVFNRGIWKKLEQQLREWAKRERIYIVTGPVFRDTKGKIGKSGVTVPGHFYKVVYAPARREMIAFMLPNSMGRKQLQEYVVTVDSVEQITKIDFFPQLPDTLENRLEASSDYTEWDN